MDVNKLKFTNEGIRRISRGIILISLIFNILFLWISFTVSYYETYWAILIIPFIVMVNSFVFTNFKRIKKYEVVQHGYIDIDGDVVSCKQIKDIHLPFQHRAVLKFKYEINNVEKLVFLISPEFFDKPRKFFPEFYSMNYESKLEAYLKNCKHETTE